MQEPESKDYFEKRAEEERAAADEAGDERAAQSHRELARRYAERANGAADEAAAGDEPVRPLPTEFKILP